MPEEKKSPTEVKKEEKKAPSKGAKYMAVSNIKENGKLYKKGNFYNGDKDKIDYFLKEGIIKKI